MKSFQLRRFFRPSAVGCREFCRSSASNRSNQVTNLALGAQPGRVLFLLQALLLPSFQPRFCIKVFQISKSSSVGFRPFLKHHLREHEDRSRLGRTRFTSWS